MNSPSRPQKGGDEPQRGKELRIDELLSLFSLERTPDKKIELLDNLPGPRELNEVETTFVIDKLDELILESKDNIELKRVVEKASLKFFIPLSSLENISDRKLLEFVVYFGNIKYSKSFHSEIQLGKNLYLKNLLNLRYPQNQKLILI